MEEYIKTVKLKAPTNELLIKAHGKYINENNERATDDGLIREILKKYLGAKK